MTTLLACRSVRSNSTGRTSRSTPTPGSPWRWPGAWPSAGPDVAVAPAVAYGASGEHAAFPGTLLVGHERPGRRCSSSSSAAHARSFRGVVFVNAHGGNEQALAVVERRCAAEGDDVLVWRATVRRRRRPRRAHRDVADVGHRRRRRPPGPGRARVHRADRCACCPVCAPKGCGRYRPTACWATPPERAPRRAAPCSTPWCADLAGVGRRQRWSAS